MTNYYEIQQRPVCTHDECGHTFRKTAGQFPKTGKVGDDSKTVVQCPDCRGWNAFVLLSSGGVRADDTVNPNPPQEF